MWNTLPFFLHFRQPLFFDAPGFDVYHMCDWGCRVDFALEDAPWLNEDDETKEAQEWEEESWGADAGAMVERLGVF